MPVLPEQHGHPHDGRREDGDEPPESLTFTRHVIKPPKTGISLTSRSVPRNPDGADRFSSPAQTIPRRIRDPAGDLSVQSCDMTAKFAPQ